MKKIATFSIAPLLAFSMSSFSWDYICEPHQERAGEEICSIQKFNDDGFVVFFIHDLYRTPVVSIGGKKSGGNYRNNFAEIIVDEDEVIDLASISDNFDGFEEIVLIGLSDSQASRVAEKIMEGSNAQFNLRKSMGGKHEINTSAEGFAEAWHEFIKKYNI